MSVFKSAEVSGSLNRKGFISSRQSHHVYFRLVHDGTPTEAVTYMSHGGHDINDYLQGRMAKQLALKLPEFQELIRCPLSRDKLLKLLIERGKITP